MESFILTFIPLFVAIDPLGSLPYFMGLTEGYPPSDRKKLAVQAILTALIVGLIFILGGNIIFKLLGITHADFQIAGGALLLIFSIQELFGKSASHPAGDHVDRFIGVVPLGIPIIAGPALITTLLILQTQHPFFTVVSAFSLNLVFTFVLLLFSEKILANLGEATSKVSAKVFAIFLASIAVMMIRRGLQTILSGSH